MFKNFPLYNNFFYSYFLSRLSFLPCRDNCNRGINHWSSDFKSTYIGCTDQTLKIERRINPTPFPSPPVFSKIKMLRSSKCWFSNRTDSHFNKEFDLFPSPLSLIKKRQFYNSEFRAGNFKAEEYYTCLGILDLSRNTRLV